MAGAFATPAGRHAKSASSVSSARRTLPATKKSCRHKCYAVNLVIAALSFLMIARHGASFLIHRCGKLSARPARQSCRGGNRSECDESLWCGLRGLCFFEWEVGRPYAALRSQFRTRKLLPVLNRGTRGGRKPHPLH